MNFKRFLSFVFILHFLIGLLFLTSVPAMASSDLTEDEVSAISSNVNITLLKEEPSKKNIDCFNVSNDGTVAILQERSSNRRVICVYDKKGEFLYGYEFTSTGSAAIEWKDELLSIYSIRSNILITVDSFGNIIDVTTYEGTSVQNSHFTNLRRSSKQEVNGITYILKNDGIAKFLDTSYSKLIVKDDEGEEVVFYESDISSQNEIYLNICKYAVLTITVVLAISLSTIFIMFIKKKLKNKKTH